VAAASAWLVAVAAGGGIGLMASGVVYRLVLGALASFVECETIAWVRETWLSTRRRHSPRKAIGAE
jgi:DNA-binding transcriptional LysR family regulator